MPYREKVIKGLKMCRVGHCDYRCPYASINVGCKNQLSDDAIAILKKREAIEPDVDSEGTCSCGNCGTTVGYYPAGCSVPEKLCKYCPECGYEVKWE